VCDGIGAGTQRQRWFGDVDGGHILILARWRHT
jgi:hypothetical protein